MSELEQLRYDRITSQLSALSDEAVAAEASGSDEVLGRVLDKVRSLSYDFNPEQMNDPARDMCQALKDSIELLVESPELVLHSSAQSSAGALHSEGTLLSRRSMTLTEPRRYPFYLRDGDRLSLSVTSESAIRVSLYDIAHQKPLRIWGEYAAVDDQLTISSDGIYVLLLEPAGKEARACSVRVSCRGVAPDARPRVEETMTGCREQDFMAERCDSISFTPLFREPKKVVLRSNLKAVFSGKPRVILALPVPRDSEGLLYSLRISTNEDIAPSDGDFAHNLSSAAKEIRLFGIKVYERRSLNNIFIDRLLLCTRPPREEDAACNMYVFSIAKEAKRFQDSSDGSANYAYDIDQSQMGTQSCNGLLRSAGGKTLYLGLENERLRYDCYIWLEVVSLSRVTSYMRPVYRIRNSRRAS